MTLSCPACISYWRSLRGSIPCGPWPGSPKAENFLRSRFLRGWTFKMTLHPCTHLQLQWNTKVTRRWFLNGPSVWVSLRPKAGEKTKKTNKQGHRGADFFERTAKGYQGKVTLASDNGKWTLTFKPLCEMSTRPKKEVRSASQDSQVTVVQQSRKVASPWKEIEWPYTWHGMSEALTGLESRVHASLWMQTWPWAEQKIKKQFVTKQTRTFSASQQNLPDRPCEQDSWRVR